MECPASPGRRGRQRAGPTRPARAAAHRTRAGVRRCHVPRGRGEVRAEPGTGRLAGALPLDREPLPRLWPRLRLLPGRGDARAARRRSHPSDRRSAARRRRAGHGGGRRRSAPLRADPGARTLVDDEARPPGHARGRHHAGGQRRAPLPDPAGMAARGARVVPGRAPPTAAPGRRPARSGCAARSPRPHRVLPAGLPARPGPCGHGRADAGPRRPDRPGLPVGAPRAGGARPGPPPPRRRGGRSRSSARRCPRVTRASGARGQPPAAQARPRRRCRAGREPRSAMPGGLPERCRRPASGPAGSACVVRPTRTTTGARGCSVAWRTPRAPPPRAFSG